MARDREVVLRGLHHAYERLLDLYARSGGFGFYGWIVQEDPRNFLGTTILTEADCVFRYGLELEKEFPGQLHFEFGLNQATRADYMPKKQGRQSVDVVVSDLTEFIEDETSMERFRTMRHDAFIEAKWLKKGWWMQQWEHDAHERVAGVASDANRLADHVRVGRCQVGAALVVDDECFFEHHRGAEWPDEVELLLVSPAELQRRGYDAPAIQAAVQKAQDLAQATLP
jgi:hypothetical protein